MSDIEDAKRFFFEGLAYLDDQNFSASEGRFIETLKLAPQSVPTLINLAIAQYKQNKIDDAALTSKRAIEIDPNNVEAYSMLAACQRQQRLYLAALSTCEKIISITPIVSEAHCNLGVVLYELGRYEEALLNIGGATLRYDEALAAYDNALAIKPDLTEAWVGRGNVFNATKRHVDAARAYSKVLEIEPHYPFGKGLLLYQKLVLCDWKDFDRLTKEIESDVASGKLSAEPFGWQAVATSERSLQLCAQLYNEKKYPAQIRNIRRRNPKSTKKICIGYLSGEFREQATAQLLVGVLENHDNTQFEIHAIDNGWDDRSEIRRRIVGSVHDVIDISRLDDSKATTAICEKQIDILINLNGYFGEHRLQVFARRPAPVQANYLGFPGTLGASYIDYIIADRHVIPEGHEGFYTEKVVYLPNCYQANDGSKKIGLQSFGRQKCGLPEKGFVFCCFNNNYKTLPHMFDCWMRLLRKIEGSVLWLLEDNAVAAGNLKKEAGARGVNPERLIFAPRMPLPEHLSRHRLADLFLDTLPYNAHTTASDALWTGLPVVTQIGDTFPGRVAASLLSSVGLPDLITATQQEYEELAIELATNSVKLAAIKNKLSQNRLTKPLFNTQLFTRHIERAYKAMYERLQAGLPPESIYVPQ